MLTEASRRGERDARLNAASLKRIMANGRPVDAASAIVNARGGRPLLNAYGRWWDVIPVEPGSLTGREQFADQALQLRVLNQLSKFPGSTVVLATGDGAGQGEGFLWVLDVAYRAGHDIELVCWSHGLNARLANYARTVGTLRLLDQLYYEVTFVEGGRFVRPWRPAGAPALSQLAGV
jgi:hypothetical protein